MKQLLFLFLVVISLKSKAQNNSYIDSLYENQSSVFQWRLKDDIAKVLPDVFNYTGLDSVTYGHEQPYRFYFTDTSRNDIIITFYKRKEGENKDLNIPGKEIISDVTISGPYLPLFNIWKAYFKPDADPVKVNKNEGDYKGDMQFQSKSGGWSIYKY